MTSWYLEEIRVEFDVWGADHGGEFEPFEKDKVYDAILAAIQSVNKSLM